MRDANLRTVDTVKSAFENIDGIVEYFSKGAHGGLAPTVGFRLSPNFPDDDRIEVPSEFIVGLFIEYLGEFFFGEQ